MGLLSQFENNCGNFCQNLSEKVVLEASIRGDLLLRVDLRDPCEIVSVVYIFQYGVENEVVYGSVGF